MNDPSPQHQDTILVVEDEILVRTSIAQYLRDCGYRVIEAGNADDAMVMLNKADVHIDILFTDIEMPGSMDGFALCQWVRRNMPDMQILLTGSNHKAAHAAANLCEEGPQLKKPYAPEQLLDQIRRLRATKR